MFLVMTHHLNNNQLWRARNQSVAHRPRTIPLPEPPWGSCGVTHDFVINESEQK